MRSAASISRIALAAALIASIGFAGACPCATATEQHSALRSSHQSCHCDSKTDGCCTKGKCRCEKDQTTRSNQSTPPTRTELVQLATVVPQVAVLPNLFAPLHAIGAPYDTVPGAGLDLIAQGTRLNI